MIKVVGKGTFQNAGLVKTYADQALGMGIHAFTIDLQECPHMDSTFMGVLAGLARRQKTGQRTPPRLVNVNRHNSELLTTLGLNRILALESAPEAPPVEAPLTPLAGTATGEKTETARTMLEAHRHLIEAHGDNAGKFQDVMKFLEAKLGRRPE